MYTYALSERIGNEETHRYWDRLRIQSFLFFSCSFVALDPPQTMGNVLHILIAGQKCLCESKKVVLWSKQFDIRIVPMSYLNLGSMNTYENKI